MNPDPRSSSFSFLLRLAVTLLSGFSTLTLFIAVCTNHWSVGSGRDEVVSLGLWKICTKTICVSHDFIVYSKVLLVFALIMAIISSVLVTLCLWFGVSDVKKLIAKFMFTTNLLTLFGMIPASVLFVGHIYTKHVTYGFILAWLSVALSLVAAIVSCGHHMMDPDKDTPILQLAQEQAAVDNNAQPPPPYSLDPPPSSVIVS